MNPQLQINTGKLLSYYYIESQDLQTTLSDTNDSVTLGTFEINPLSTNSVIDITYFQNTLFSSLNTPSGQEFLRVQIFRNSDPTAIFTGSFQLIPFVSPGSISNLPVNFSFSFTDNDFLSNTPLGEPVKYTIQILAINFTAITLVSLFTLDSLKFEEIESPTKLKISTPLS